jgi:hypothetical protein
LPDPKLVGSLSDGIEGYYAYIFLADASRGDIPKNKVIMAWNVGGAKTVALQGLPERVTITDMLGTSRTCETDSGALSVEIGPFPIYLSAAQ